MLYVKVTFVNDACYVKGQVTIRKCTVLGGEGVTVLHYRKRKQCASCKFNGYALMRFQEQMGGKAEKAGFLTEEAVAEWITRSRREENAE